MSYLSNINYNFSNQWFDGNISVWNELFDMFRPKRILEIGSYEGRSTCFMIEKLKTAEIHCVDSWEGGMDHDKDSMAEVENRFHHNISVAKKITNHKIDLIIHKGLSSLHLPKLLTEKTNYFDLIYIDASHQSPDVLFDAVTSFPMLKSKGLMIFDDYLWNYPKSVIDQPKIAIDAFTTIYSNQLEIFTAPLSQMYIRKI